MSPIIGGGGDRSIPSSSLEEAILSYLRGRDASAPHATRKEIQTHVQSASAAEAVGKKDVKKTLKRLVKQGNVAMEGKSYSIVEGSETGGSGSSEEEGEASPAEPALPIAQRMRRKQQSMPASDDAQGDGEPREDVDIDEEIRRLEAELAADEDSESDDDDGSDDEAMSDGAGSSVDERSNKKISFGETSVKEYDVENGHVKRNNSKSQDVNGDASGVICLSNLADERIEPLPPSALPQNKRRTLKIDSTTEPTDGSGKRKKRKRENEQQHEVSAGLRDAVKDLLQNYTPRSQVNGVPFYCRVCQHQSSNQEDFNAHRASDFHKAAVNEERKRTYCKLCRKQLTSVVQMEEHLKSRPHRERMDYVKEKQRGLVGSRPNGGGGGGRGRGFNNRGPGGGKRDGSGRQWC